ncbi:MAG: histidinol dehydrogenase [Planctomycetaceae bacterium]|jgi:histidinol dehydrogenase|nr:histidinol dehydrogenase [Planctomycetaceae bacterium]
MKLFRIDRRGDAEVVASQMLLLRERLGTGGDVVSESSRRLTEAIFGEALSPQQVVERICRDVRQHGTSALLKYSSRIDGADLNPSTLRVSASELEAAHAAADKEFLNAIKRVRENIRRFQETILHNKDIRIEFPDGYIRERYLPLRRVGVCVPGGAAAYPSTVLMTAVPAQVAGVREIAVMMPPTKFGAYNPDMLATCFELGIDEVYRMGGAQGIAALAYGIKEIPAVDKIVGPGNMFVAMAKRFVNGDVSIDMIAGPSELVVIIDGTVDPIFIAYDLIAQAEHSPGVCFVVGWDVGVLEFVLGVVEAELCKTDRGELARASLERFGAVIIAKDEADACQVTNLLAPEHLIIAAKNAEAMAEIITAAGAIFIGGYTPAALGDYAAGPSHVLPTSGTARFASGLTCNDFIKANSMMSFSKEGLKRYAKDIEIIAAKEELHAHNQSVKIRVT